MFDDEHKRVSETGLQAYDMVSIRCGTCKPGPHYLLGGMNSNLGSSQDDDNNFHRVSGGETNESIDSNAIVSPQYGGQIAPTSSD